MNVMLMSSGIANVLWDRRFVCGESLGVGDDEGDDEGREGNQVQVSDFASGYWGREPERQVWCGRKGRSSAGGPGQAVELGGARSEGS